MKRLLLLGLACFGIFSLVTLFNTSALQAAPKDDACAGVALTGGSCDAPASGPGVQSTITDVINIFSLVVGVAAVIMIIIGGFKYVTSGGDSGKVSGAKDTILYALIGLVIVALSQVIVRFVINQFTN